VSAPQLLRGGTQGQSSDKPTLSAKRRWRVPRDTADVAGAACRLIAVTGTRIAGEDPDRLRHLIEIENELRIAWEVAVDGLRRNWPDAEIGAELGVTKQAVQQRWPR
jgi:hypothetical protein